MTIDLGDRVIDPYTRIEGRVLKIELHLYRPPLYIIEREGVDQDGRPWKLEEFYRDQLGKF